MMDNTYLVFGHRGARYGLSAAAVREIVWLPALSPIEELPPYIAGIFNLRGRVIPVLDLSLRFGHVPEPYRPSDRVIVIEIGEARVGLIVNELYDVLTLEQTAVEDARSYQSAGAHPQFVRGEAKLEDGLAMLLDEAALLRSAPAEATLAHAAPAAGSEGLPHLYAELSSTEAEVFGSRARSLAQVPSSGERAGEQAYAVIRLDGELFALELDAVREFSHLRGVTPLPCCPPHIAGNMNLRGDILTLVDIRPALDMAAGGAMSEVVVVRSGDLLLGLQATEIVDVIHLAAPDIAPVPVASDHAGKAYCKGVAAVAGPAIGLLDLEKILAARELQVAEEVQ
jgi:purine-binding chemotaxis protein CheW